MGEEMTNEKKTCAFTGHRPDKLPFQAVGDEGYHALMGRLKDEILRHITQKGAVHFVSGMAAGVDLMAAQAVLFLKRRYPHITLEAAVPHKKQIGSMGAAWRDVYCEVLAACDTVTVLNETYCPGCFHQRNRYMVDKADYVIAVWDGTPGGTGYTVDYAQKKGVPVTLLQKYPFIKKRSSTPKIDLLSDEM